MDQVQNYIDFLFYSTFKQIVVILGMAEILPNRGKTPIQL
jgi:hypothetical protein